MLIPLQPPETWDIINENLRLELGYKSENPIRCYPNLYSAVEEVTSQLASFLSHKRNFTWIKGMSPTFEAPLSVFLREGFQIQSVDWKVYSQFIGQEAQWVETLPSNTLYVLVFEDHAVTGMKQNYADLEMALAAKKIFLIRVSHFQLPDKVKEISPFTIWIGPTGLGDLAVAVCGARFRAPERGIPYHPWKVLEKSERVVFHEDKSLVESIESQFPEEKWFDAKQERRFDRVALCCPDIAGQRVIKRLESKLGQNLKPHQAQTTHGCSWNSIKVLKAWWTPMPTPEQLRGLVLFSTDIAKLNDFATILKQTLQELRSEADWG